MNDPFLEKHIHDIPDFPKPGIVFKDISPLLASTEARIKMTESLVQKFKKDNINVVVGIESRGFLFGMLMANALNAKFVMVRKPGKLPGELIDQEYELEYGTDTIEIQQNAIQSNDNVLIHDDVLATGGTAAAAHSLISKLGAEIAGYSFMIELDFLKGREKLPASKTHSVLHF
ncbi:adenine phosphoribosyltransferase [Nonlabens dokdonensis]|jgi:adenine phosphoribosyltransferase|uniref:Adenine phosphoribosyltransferase n=2 Tax=Nonlabens dokdonensis TaxID=328515 RepID=L7W5F7_NONDD|nr:adenine phosphoribosyltransferase [Nonlabens dokdonensis]AGC75304.1 adenine phosphoribosyltransferase (APRT) [Nonlabens dokdonensis DSW-6]PZX43013.1 adenine phosphoribosyltransferase [Nonlabens dokdonensis]